MIHLVLGGVRSGKSRYAESLIARSVRTQPHREQTSPTVPQAVYVAPGPTRDDPDWAARVAAHQARRPATWLTLETADLPAALAGPAPVVVDCLGTWVTRLVDEALPDHRAWDDPERALAAVEDAVQGLIAALDRPDDTVLVSNEVGLGIVPEHRSGRLFRDALGHVNATLADAADHVVLVVAGRVLDLSAAPRVR